MAHILVLFIPLPSSLFYFINPFPSHCPHLHPLYISPDTVEPQSTLVKKNYLKWQETWLLATCSVDGIKGKEELCENFVRVTKAIHELQRFENLKLAYFNTCK